MGRGYGLGLGIGRGRGLGYGRGFGQGKGGFSGYSCVKFLFFGFNVFFWLLGCAILGVGIWLQVSKGSFASLSPSFNFLSATALCITAGVLILIVGFFGCCGAIMESKCLLMTYFILIIIIFILEVVTSALAVVYCQEIETLLETELKKGISEKYTDGKGGGGADEEGLKSIWAYTQTSLKCCGVNNYTDWYNAPAWPDRQQVPTECCVHNTSDCNSLGPSNTQGPSNWHPRGCLNEVKLNFLNHLYVLGIVGICIGVIQVKLWLTFNEPWVVSWLGYGVAAFAPGVYGPDVSTYVVTHNIIKSHAAAWHTYDDEFRALQNGRISITLDIDWKQPLTASAEDLEAADRATEFKLGWFAHAIIIDGDYPPVMIENIAAKSAQEGRETSRLPQFTEAEKLFNKGTYDFLGINHYSSVFVTTKDRTGESPGWENDRDVEESIDPSWPTSGSDWLRVVPWGIRRLLVWIKNHYGNPEVMITENGVSDIPAEYGSLQDQFREDFYRDYINNVLKAVRLDGCNVVGYTAWSLMDNFEWNDGYEATFGLHLVDFNDPTRERIPKQSAAFYKQLIVDHGWPTSKKP